MWRQHSARPVPSNNHHQKQQNTNNSFNAGNGLTSLDPNNNNNHNHNHHPQNGNNNNSSMMMMMNLSKQSIDMDNSKSETNNNNNLSSATTTTTTGGAGIPSVDISYNPNNSNHNQLMYQAYQNNYLEQQNHQNQQQYLRNLHQQQNNNNVSTTSAAPAPVNHRDRFQMYLERYAPNHPETAMRRAQIVHKNTEQTAVNPSFHQHPAVENVAQSMMMRSTDGDDGETSTKINNQERYFDPRDIMMSNQQEEKGNSNQKQEQQQELPILRLMSEQEHQHKNKEKNNTSSNNKTSVEDIESHSVAVLDIRPERLRFELCASRSEADQLRKRITTLQNMNDHLREKLEEAMLSEREQVVRANSFESQDRTLQERLTDAEAEVRELKRRLNESESARSQTETKLAQARGRLAAFDHIANDFTSNNSSSSNANFLRKSTRPDTVSELVQSLSTSHYLLSVLSLLRFWFNMHHQKQTHVSRPDEGIVVHLGGGKPPATVSSLAQATQALQDLVCGNRETESETRTRVVGWTPDDMLREVRSVAMTCETMVVRLLTDGAVGTMLRKSPASSSSSALHIQNQQQHQNRSSAPSNSNNNITSSIQYYAPSSSIRNNQQQQQQQQQAHESDREAVEEYEKEIQGQAPTQQSSIAATRITSPKMGVSPQQQYDEEKWLGDVNQDQVAASSLSPVQTRIPQRNGRTVTMMTMPMTNQKTQDTTVSTTTSKTTLHSPQRTNENSTSVSRNLRPTYNVASYSPQNQNTNGEEHQDQDEHQQLDGVYHQQDNNQDEDSAQYHREQERLREQQEQEARELERLRLFGGGASPSSGQKQQDDDDVCKQQ